MPCSVRGQAIPLELLLSWLRMQTLEPDFLDSWFSTIPHTLCGTGQVAYPLCVSVFPSVSGDNTNIYFRDFTAWSSDQQHPLGACLKCKILSF